MAAWLYACCCCCCCWCGPCLKSMSCASLQGQASPTPFAVHSYRACAPHPHPTAPNPPTHTYTHTTTNTLPCAGQAGVRGAQPSERARRVHQACCLLPGGPADSSALRRAVLCRAALWRAALHCASSPSSRQLLCCIVVCGTAWRYALQRCSLPVLASGPARQVSAPELRQRRLLD